MNKALKIALLMGLVAGVLFFALRNDTGDSNDEPLTESHSTVSLAEPQRGEFEYVKEQVDRFLDMKAGHFSSTTTDDLLNALQANKEVSLELAKVLQTEPSLARQLMGLFMELELVGYSDALQQYVHGQDSLLFGAATAQWLYLHHDFDNWSAFLQLYSERDVANKTVQLFAYLENPEGEGNLPAGFSHLPLGKVGEGFIKEFLRRSPEAQLHFRNHLIEGETTPSQRNTALVILKAIRSDYFAETLNHFLAQFPENSQSHGYLTYLRDQSIVVSLESIKPHIDLLESQSSDPFSQLPSVVAVLEAMETNSKLPIEGAVLETMASILNGLPVQTPILKQKAADVAYAQWTALSQ